MSPVRFAYITYSPSPSLSFFVNGAEDEVVDVAVVVPGDRAGDPGTIRRVMVAFTSSGATTVVCSGVGNGAACLVS